jgi:alpha-galactosidase
MKVVAIGIGSVIFGVNLLRDLFRTPEFRGSELSLVDVDPVGLERMTRLADRLNDAADWDVSIDSAIDRREVLARADFVITSLAVDRIRTWKIDHELALRHGFASVLSENGGPGGLSHTLRSVPLVLDVAADIEELAPSAVLLNYTNPENRVCRALQRYTPVRSIGLCHSVAEAIDRCATLLGRPRTDLDVRAAGVNHFTWFTSIRDGDGTDLLPEFRKRALDAARGEETRLWRMLIERFGVVPAIDDDHVGEYLPWAAELIGTAGYDFGAHERHAREASEMLDGWGSGQLPVEGLLAEPSDEARVDHSAAEIIADIISGRTRRRPSFILPNTGLIDELPGESAVEVPGLVKDGAAGGVAVGRLPEPITALLRHELAIQDLAVEAAVSGSRPLALEALLLDPVVHSARAAEAFLDDILRAHRQYLPRFWT